MSETKRTGGYRRMKLIGKDALKQFPQLLTRARLASAMDHIPQASGFSLNLIQKGDDVGLTQRGMLV